MIEINDKHYFGEGLFQKCYVHPHDENRCLKIHKVDNHRKQRVAQEIDYYKKIQKRNKNYPFLASYHGEKETNLGIAAVYDLIRDETANTISLTMLDYLEMDSPPFSDAFFMSQIDVLKKKLIKNRIVVTDFTIKNIRCKIKADNSVEFIIIDGLGHRDFFPIADWFSFFTKRKMERVIKKKKLHTLNAHREFLKTIAG